MSIGNTRRVIYNLAPSGIVDAEADIGGGIFGADIKAARWLTNYTFFRPLLSGLFRISNYGLGDYHEELAAGISVDDRQDVVD